MKTSMKQQNLIIASFIENGLTEADALRMIARVTASNYKVIGITGLVDSCKDAKYRIECQNLGGISMAEFTIVGESEKALMLSKGCKTKWVAKSVIKTVEGNTIVPTWAWDK